MSELLEFIFGCLLDCLLGWMETCEYQRFFACFLLSIAAAALTTALLPVGQWLESVIWVGAVLAGLISGLVWENHSWRPRRTKQGRFNGEGRKKEGAAQWPPSPLI